MTNQNQYLHEVARDYQLIDGIYDELVMTENQRKGKKSEWTRFL